MQYIILKIFFEKMHIVVPIKFHVIFLKKKKRYIYYICLHIFIFFSLKHFFVRD